MGPALRNSVLCALALSPAACHGEDGGAGWPVQRLLPPDSGDASLSWETADLEGRELRFADGRTPTGVSIVGLVGEPRPDGLLVRPTASDAHLVVEGGDLRPDHLVLELTTWHPVRLLVRAGPAGRSTGDRSLTVATDGSGRKRVYDIDLSTLIAVGEEIRLLRIAPVGPQARCVLHRIVLSRSVPRLVGGEGPTIGRLTVGGETRSTLALQGSASYTVEARVGPGSRLVFGLASSELAGGEVEFSVEADGGRQLFLEVFGTGGTAPGWREHTVDLSACPPRCRLTMASTPRTPSAVPPLLFVSNPAVIHGRRRGPPNLILISLDTLRPDFLASYGGPESDSPGITALAREGVLFERAYANSSVTHLSHATLLTGKWPTSSTYFWLDGRVDDVTLASRLRAEGFLTAAFSGGVLVSRAYGFDRGFDSFFEYDTLFRPPLQRTDMRVLTARALDWTDRHRGAPFFLFLHTYEVHGPYVERQPGATAATSGCTGLRSFNPVHMRGRLPVAYGRVADLVATSSPEGGEVLLSSLDLPCEPLAASRRAYRSELRALDATIAELLAALRERGALEHTIVVLTADHGEAFFEHGLLEHGLLYDENLRVPLILRAPGHLPAGRRVRQRVSLVDVVPTIMDLLGLAHSREVDGRSLLPLLRKEGPERSFFAFVPGNGLAWYGPGASKLSLRAAVGQENFGRNELFDLDADPAETRNLLRGAAGIPRPLQRRMWDTIDRIPGVHVDLGALGGGTYEVDLPLPSSYRDLVYAFGTERLGPPSEDAPGLRCILSPTPRSRLVLIERRADVRLRLSLRPVDRDQWSRYDLAPSDLPLERRRFPPADGASPPLVAWRVSEPSPVSGGPPEETRRKLRALGYLQ